MVPNLSPAGLQWAKRLGSPERALEAIETFVRSHAVQEVWARVYGAADELAVPLG